MAAPCGSLLSDTLGAKILERRSMGIDRQLLALVGIVIVEQPD